MSNPPSLLFINQHYHPDFAATAQHLTDLAEHLADEGFEVHVLCSAGHYLSGAMDVPMEETHNSVHIHRVRATAFGRGTMLGRLVDYASFFLRALARVLTRSRYDLVVSLTTPPLIALVGTVARIIRRQPYAIWSMDLHPDAEVAVDMLHPRRRLTRLLHALNNWAYKRAEFVVDLGPYMKRRLTDKGIPDERLHTIPVWNKKEEVYPIPEDENPLVSEVGLEDKFVIMYSGNAGLGHRFQEVLEAMQYFDGHPEIHFLFVGSGPRKEEIISYVDEHDLSNVTYLPYFPREQIKYSLSLADVHLLTLYNSMAGIAVPGKLYGILAAGRPVLMVGPTASDPAATIREHEVGEVVDPHGGSENATKQFIRAVETLYNDAERRREMGKRGREVFLEEFEREKSCTKWESVLRTWLDQNRRTEL